MSLLPKIVSPLAALTLLFTVNATAQIQLTGKMEQGALIRAMVEPGTQVYLNGEALKVTPEGAFAFGFAREAELKQELKLVYPDGLTQIKPLSIKTKEYKIDRVNGISKKIMKPDPKAVERSRKDSKQVKAARSQFSEIESFTQDFIWPLTGRISGVYGSQRVYNGKPGNPHYGVDVAAKTGTVVVAPADGVISLSVADMFYSGGTIILDHGYGVSSSFLHLSKLYVKDGEVIKQGQPIAEVGATGRVTGPHLDWRVNWYQMRLDPVTIVPNMAEVLKK
ncbi:metalloendopeptidase-like membrane protein [Shewanella psychrophila]|uniref:Metalloendopeptidase-like membrane protein n=1 Tax=Shewanella psychrophila TaxID=225848 RepID=A0A1S6HJF3_9GAMM|nr:M23 family metallopeptidase [Shewanella psychrophila]AQS35652.1 metalloendopeptidase-like membrane protein [Shewanella psychrophila]